MLQVRKAQDRGLAEHGWLKSYHTFSFADYYDAKHMHFSALRVINEDRIDGGTGFGAHGHKDMEIISYVIDGALEHKDSMGSDAVIRPGDVQRMSAGTGVRHSEQNHLKDKTTHFLQIWIIPEKQGIPPGYGQKSFETDFAGGGLVLVGSKNGRDGSISINQDVNMYACKTPTAGEKTLATAAGRSTWVQVIKGHVSIDGTTLTAGDGAGITAATAIEVKWEKDAEFIVFDLP